MRSAWRGRVNKLRPLNCKIERWFVSSSGRVLVLRLQAPENQDSNKLVANAMPNDLSASETYDVDFDRMTKATTNDSNKVFLSPALSVNNSCCSHSNKFFC